MINKKIKIKDIKNNFKNQLNLDKNKYKYKFDIYIYIIFTI